MTCLVQILRKREKKGNKDMAVYMMNKMKKKLNRGIENIQQMSKEIEKVPWIICCEKTQGFNLRQTTINEKWKKQDRDEVCQIMIR